MSIIKHTEYKIICDGCGYEMTDWKHASRQAFFLRIVKAEFGEKLYKELFSRRKEHFCEDCQPGSQQNNKQ